MAKKKWGVHCAVSWCVCLVKAESQYCAVHATRGKDYKPSEPTAGATVACDECDGSGECPDCDGEGEHQCEHRNCDDIHECGTCDGTGECEACHLAPPRRGDLGTFDERYIAFAFDPGWVPPVLVDYPWDVA